MYHLIRSAVWAVAIVGLIAIGAPDILHQIAEAQPRTNRTSSTTRTTSTTTRNNGRTNIRTTTKTKSSTANSSYSTSNTVTRQGAANFSGTWLSPEWGEVRMTQQGNKLRGSYDHQQGQIEGTIKGDKVEMRWWEPSKQGMSYDETIHPERGTAKFRIDPKAGALKGDWRYERTLPADSADGAWTMRKLGSLTGPTTRITTNASGSTTTTNNKMKTTTTTRNRPNTTARPGSVAANRSSSSRPPTAPRR